MIFETLPSSVKPAKGTLVIYPPASGFKPKLKTELQELMQLGFSVTLVQPPYLRPDTAMAPRGLQHPQQEKQLWELTMKELGVWLMENHQQPAPRVAFGFNLGGSMAALAGSLMPFDAIIATGSIPQLSRFYIGSPHPAAVQNRQQGPFDAKAFSEAMSDFDLVSTLNKISKPAFVQFGMNDDWIETPDIEKLEKAKPASTQIKWSFDDHDMLSAESIKQRRGFLEGLLKK